MKLEMTNKLKVPICFYSVEIDYKATKEPSGIEFILLTLISDDARKTLGTTVVAELEDLDIPKILHPLFYQTIQRFIDDGTIIIGDSSGDSSIFDKDYNEEKFNNVSFKDINLTPRGKELFQKKYILTGETKKKLINIFFYPMSESVEMSCPYKFCLRNDEYFKEEDNFTEEFFVSILNDLTQDIIQTKIEDCIYSNLRNIGLKPFEEIISITPNLLNCGHVSPEDNLTICIEDYEVKFSFKTQKETDYFYKHYPASMINALLRPKKKFTFFIQKNQKILARKIAMENLPNVKNYYLPEEINSKSKQLCKIYLNREELAIDHNGNCIKLEKQNSNSILDILEFPAEIPEENSETLVETTQENLQDNAQEKNSEIPAETTKENLQNNTPKFLNHTVQFALLSQSTLTYYSAVNAIIPCSKLNDVCEFQLLVEHVAPKELYNQVIQKIYDCYYQEAFEKSKEIISFCTQELNDPSLWKKYLQEIYERYYQEPFEKSKEIVLSCINSLKDATLWQKYIECQLEKQDAESQKTSLFSKMDSYFSGKTLWNDVRLKLAKKLWNDIFSSSTLDNLSSKISTLKSLKKYRSISDSEYITKIIEHFPDAEKNKLYIALEKCKFNANDILFQVNIIPIYMNKILQHESIDSLPDSLSDFKTLDTNFWKLNDLLGINDCEKYTIKQDYNAREFENAYQTLKSISYREYETFAIEEFKKLEKYREKIYEPISEFLAMEKSAESNPKNIKEEYITRLIEQGRFKEAMISLLTKVDYDLKKYWKSQNIEDPKEIDKINANDIIEKSYKESLMTKKQRNSLHQLRKCRNNYAHPSSKSTEPRFSKSDIENWRDISFALETSLKEKVEEQKRLAEEAKKKEEAKKQEEAKKLEEEQKRLAEEAKKKEEDRKQEQNKKQEEARKQEEAKKLEQGKKQDKKKEEKSKK